MGGPNTSINTHTDIAHFLGSEKSFKPNSVLVHCGTCSEGFLVPSSVLPFDLDPWPELYHLPTVRTSLPSP